MEPQPEQVSRVCVNFGQKIEGNTPFDLTLDFNLFSQKAQNIKFNFQEHLGINLPERCFVMEVEVNKDAETLAVKVNEGMTDRIKLIEQGGGTLKIVGKSNKVYFIGSGGELEKMFQAQEGMLSIATGGQNLSEQDKCISLRIQSENSLYDIFKRSEKDGIITSLTDSLQMRANFVLNAVTAKVVQNLIKELTPTQKLPLLSVAQNIKLQIKCESSKLLQSFPNLVEKPFKNQKQEIGDILKEGLKGAGQKVKLHILTNKFTVNAGVQAKDLAPCIDLFIG